MPQELKIKRYRPSGYLRLYGNNYRPTHLTYQILDGLYDRTILQSIIETIVSNVIPPFFSLTIEDENEDRLAELEKECKGISRVINRSYMTEAQKSFLLYGTALTYTGNRDKSGMVEEVFLLHPNDVVPVFYDIGDPQYGEIKYWRYEYGGKVFEIPPEDIKVYANDPNIGSIFGRSIVNHLQDTLAQFLNNRYDLSEILNRYAIPIVQWAIDVENVQEPNQENFINTVRMSLQEQFAAGDDIVSDARVEPRTLSFANDISHLISILDASRKDLGMLGVPESLMGGQISNLSGGKTQAAVFMTKANRYRATLNDYLALEFYVPELQRLGYTQGTEFHNVYIAFPPATTELPSDSIIWVKTAIEMGLIYPTEGRAVLGFRGKAPGVTDELEEIYKVRSVQYNSDTTEDNKAQTEGNQTDGSTSKTKVDEPTNKDGREPK